MYELICGLSLSTELSPVTTCASSRHSRSSRVPLNAVYNEAETSFVHLDKTSRRNNTRKKPQRPPLPLDMNSANASSQRKLSRACVHFVLCKTFSNNFLMVYRSHTLFCADVRVIEFCDDVNQVRVFFLSERTCIRTRVLFFQKS